MHDIRVALPGFFDFGFALELATHIVQAASPVHGAACTIALGSDARIVSAAVEVSSLILDTAALAAQACLVRAEQPGALPFRLPLLEGHSNG